MPFFEVTLSDGTTRTLQGHNKTQVREALKGVVLKQIMHIKRCRQCKKVPATVQNTFCQPCWEQVLSEFRATWEGEPIPEQEFESLVMSFFVEG